MQTVAVAGLCVALLSAVLADLCKKCTCNEKHLNCNFMSLENHFESPAWEGTGQIVATFDGNKIIHLKAFPKLPLIRLSLTHNSIAKIDPACFKELHNLTELDLSHNHLTSEQLLPNIFQGHYAPDAYEPLQSLKILKLSANALHSMDADLFEHLPNLELLALDSNPLRIIDRQTVIALTSINYLKVLDLSSTSLRSLPEHLLHTPRFLETLNLSSNLFPTPPQALEDSHTLKTLILDENPFPNITNFPNLPYLEVLSISWMPELKWIGPNALSTLVSLQELYCSHNPKLETINGTAFMKTTTEGEKWPSLKKLALNNNKLGYLNVELFDNWERMEMVNIQNNPWVCECHNQWLVSSLVPMLENRNSSKHNVEGIVCHWPQPMRGRSIAELDHRSYKMRCLDAYDNHPENDATLLVGVLLGVVMAVPIAILVFLSLRRHLLTSAAQYHRAFYKKGDSLHEFVTHP